MGKLFNWQGLLISIKSRPFADRMYEIRGAEVAFK